MTLVLKLRVFPNDGSPCIELLYSYNLYVMKIAFCSLLAVIQVLTCTVGQGALTLCVRTNGTQRLLWTSSSSINKKSDAQQCSCGCDQDDHCCSSVDDVSLDSARIDAGSCKSCTDYQLMAAQPAGTVEKYKNSMDGAYFHVQLPFLSIYQIDSMASRFNTSELQSLLPSKSTALPVVMRC